MGPLPKAEHAYAVVASFVPLYNVLPFKITLNSGRMRVQFARRSGSSGSQARGGDLFTDRPAAFLRLALVARFGHPPRSRDLGH